MTDTVCDRCRWRVLTSQHVTLDGKSERLCSACLDRAVERRSLEVRIRGMEQRMAAQSKHYHRLEEEFERMRCLLAELTNCDDTEIREVPS